MIQRSVIHDTFSITRNYPATPAQVFSAFASPEAKAIWADDSSLEASDPDAVQTEFEFRIGGHERFGFKNDGKTYQYDAVYYDIVPGQRIIYSYEMYADDARISVSVATLEFAKVADGTALTYTEQGAFLDGIDGPEAGALRKGGTEEMLDSLTGYLASRNA